MYLSKEALKGCFLMIMQRHTRGAPRAEMPALVDFKLYSLMPDHFEQLLADINTQQEGQITLNLECEFYLQWSHTQRLTFTVVGGDQFPWTTLMIQETIRFWLFDLS